MTRPFLLLGCLLLLFTSCKEKTAEVELNSPKKTNYAADTLTLSSEERYDKVLGALVGSAIGDAMGVATEMWYRKDIQLKYGYMNGIVPAIRDQQAEGPWENNLSAGATTDDTRWKYFLVQYLSTHDKKSKPKDFAKFITDYYANLTGSLAVKDMRTNIDLLDDQIEKIDWIKEWARVALAYQESPDAYQMAQSRFYGGEMSCAGQLYSPVFGLVAENPEEAYDMAYDNAIFDLGYAKDISGLVAAMTNMAMRTQNMDSILNTAFFVDPNGYQDSRLVGRISTKTADAAIRNVQAVKQLVLIDSLVARDTILFRMPEGFKGAQKDWVRQETVYSLLEKNEKAIAWHSGEIWEILITGLQFGDGDFLKTMRFIANYGRDNDTVGAVAGMILGAKEGYQNLPVELREQALKVNKENLGIDLKAMAAELVVGMEAQNKGSLPN